MLLIETFIDRPVAEALGEFNIRSVEQLLALSNNTRYLRSLSTAVNLDFAEFADIVSQLKEQYPDLSSRPLSKRKFFTGYRVDDDYMDLAQRKVNH